MTLPRKRVDRNVSQNPMEGIMKRTSSQSAEKKKTAGGRVRRVKQAGRCQLNEVQLDVNSNTSSEVSRLTQDQLAIEQSDLKRLKELPKEIGVMLIAAGVVGLILPGPGTPALIAGGVALWPGGLASWSYGLNSGIPMCIKRV